MVLRGRRDERGERAREREREGESGVSPPHATDDRARAGGALFGVGAKFRVSRAERVSEVLRVCVLCALGGGGGEGGWGLCWKEEEVEPRSSKRSAPLPLSAHTTQPHSPLPSAKGRRITNTPVLVSTPEPASEHSRSVSTRVCEEGRRPHSRSRPRRSLSALPRRTAARYRATARAIRDAHPDLERSCVSRHARAPFFRTCARSAAAAATARPPSHAPDRPPQKSKRDEREEAMTSIHPQTCSELWGPKGPRLLIP